MVTYFQSRKQIITGILPTYSVDCVGAFMCPCPVASLVSAVSHISSSPCAHMCGSVQDLVLSACWKHSF